MRPLLCVVMLARAALAQRSVGVCVVSTGRDFRSGNSTEGLGRIATLMASLAGQGVRRCLVSDFRVHAAAAAATLRRRKEVCRIVNANATARLIVGLSKCGMHGEEPVRLKRLKRPWVDKD